MCATSSGSKAASPPSLRSKATDGERAGGGAITAEGDSVASRRADNISSPERLLDEASHRDSDV